MDADEREGVLERIWYQTYGEVSGKVSSLKDCLEIRCARSAHHHWELLWAIKAAVESPTRVRVWRSIRDQLQEDNNEPGLPHYRPGTDSGVRGR